MALIEAATGWERRNKKGATKEKNSSQASVPTLRSPFRSVMLL